MMSTAVGSAAAAGGLWGGRGATIGLGLALDGAVLVPREGADPIGDEALGGLARTYLLAEAVTRRLASYIDPEVLQIMLAHDIEVSLDDEAADVRPPCDATTNAWQHRSSRLEYLREEPEARKDQRRDIEEDREKTDWLQQVGPCADRCCLALGHKFPAWVAKRTTTG